MDKRFLERCLAEGLSLDQIGEKVGKHPSTVGYWVKKHRLTAVGRGKYAGRGGIDVEVLEFMAEDGSSLAEMADELGRSMSTIRYWLKVYGLQSGGGRRRRAAQAARESGARIAVLECDRHGFTEFVLETRGYFRCMRCRAIGVAHRRRVVKQTLVAEAGGRCVVCGYDRCQAALQFHHLEPSSKRYALSQNGVSRSIARSRAEARKCILLCANCHAEVETGVTDLPIQLRTQGRFSEVA